MAPFKHFQKLLQVTLCVIVIILGFDQCFATPQLSQQDPCVIYSTKCSDKFYEKRDKMQFKLGLAPFYQQTHYARNGDGHKVPLDEMNGRWNMLAPFFDVAKMTPDAFNKANYPHLYTSKQNLIINGTDYSLMTNYDPNAIVGTSTGEPPVDYLLKQMVSFYSTRCNYEKFGLRGKIGFELGCGFGINVKSGIVDLDYKSTGSHALFDSTYQKNSNNVVANGLYNALLSGPASAGIFNDLPLDIKEDHKTTFEDTHVEVYFQVPFDFKDAGETVVTFAPYFSIGGWLPTGEEKDHGKFYSLPSGNNGHYCLTAEGSLNFDFPGTVQLSVGGGALVADSHEYSVFSLPTNIYQEGFYPWTTKVEVDPGTTWYFNASFKAENFMYDLSFYFDYVYTYHEMDDITIKEDSSSVNSISRKTAFEDMKSEYLNKTIWKDQRFNAGLSYKIVSQLSLGCALQAHISGARVFKATTEMAYIDLTF